MMSTPIPRPFSTSALNPASTAALAMRFPHRLVLIALPGRMVADRRIVVGGRSGLPGVRTGTSTRGGPAAGRAAFHALQLTFGNGARSLSARSSSQRTEDLRMPEVGLCEVDVECATDVEDAEANARTPLWARGRSRERIAATTMEAESCCQAMGDGSTPHTCTEAPPFSWGNQDPGEHGEYRSPAIPLRHGEPDPVSASADFVS